MVPDLERGSIDRGVLSFWNSALDEKVDDESDYETDGDKLEIGS